MKENRKSSQDTYPKSARGTDNNPIKENPYNGRDTDVTIQLKRKLKNVLEDVFQSSRIFFEMQLVDQGDILTSIHFLLENVWML